MLWKEPDKTNDNHESWDLGLSVNMNEPKGSFHRIRE